jgi:hypothetical protein
MVTARLMWDRVQPFCLVLCPALLVFGTVPVWQKPIPSWTEEDARQILADSPWSQAVIATVIQSQSEEARRDGGNMGQLHGPGYDGLGEEKSRAALPSTLYGDRKTASAAKAPIIRLLVRWESAFPIRVAELKLPDTGVSTSPEGGYAIAVYGVPGTYFGDPRRLGNRLKSFALLRRKGKNDVKASSAEVNQLESGAAVLYLFPFSAAINSEDGFVEFEAQIGRLAVLHTFDLRAMQLEGKLQL